ncbi:MULTISPECIES: hypothetical protein [unclassified Leisingera]|uniref:hypothetical protein n=1 Tax=unclassified Leisingera TaxID=2614906 RepID=UPI0002E8FD1A|nr:MULTISPECIES: hypothetical protein [unclassified Leisingera]KIC16765.1 hypothetical protein RA21_11195 [Leisingera sp. ANG-DT]KIC25665.1 hypothetical protein RA23_07410 [Leisingera sp. ANG-S3]KIC34481.1 hypothetical protein RA25_01410 [Leisingera sp. ANG-S5]KIC54231.1 hypothetical protein RA22_06135 [Leisingera sp. ANG-S]KID10948.1 hypothetical protein GC1_04620 [Leisingera sp. ANG1]
MTYQLTLKSADVPDVMTGSLSLGIQYQNAEAASIDVTWTQEHFTARFNGFAPGMPVPAHPLAFVKGAMDALNAAKAAPDEPAASVFGRGPVSFEV